MIRKVELLVLLGFVSVNLVRGQAVPATILEVDVENQVEYQDDISDVTKFATSPNSTTSTNFRNFSVATVIADIVAINGQPAKGLYAARARSIQTAPNATPGLAIADVQRAAMREEVMEILDKDGNPIGTIVSLGLSGGSAPPGSPAAQKGVNFAIVGGTGAFVGVRGTSGSATSPAGVAARSASMTEDPANRRINGGGKTRRLLTLIPMSVPQIVAVTHSLDFAPVTIAKPAATGEVLSLFATGLGPTRPGVDPGQPFPSTPAQVVNSPVQVMVNGKVAEIIGAVGFPNSADGYQVNFRLPSDTGKGTVTIQLSAAWIAGAPATVAVQ